MPTKRTIEKAKQDAREGKSPSTQAGEFVKAEIDRIRSGAHGARSARQAIAIGLPEARRAGIDLPPPKKGTVSEGTRKSAEYAYEVGRHERVPTPRPKVAKAVKAALGKEPRSTVSPKALSEHARDAAGERTAKERSASARKAAETKGPAERSEAATKAARTRARNQG